MFEYIITKIIEHQSTSKNFQDYKNFGTRLHDYTSKQNQIFPKLPVTNFELLFLFTYCMLLSIVVIQAIKYTQDINRQNLTQNLRQNLRQRNYTPPGMEIQIFDRRRLNSIRNNFSRRNGYLPYDENSPVAKWRASLRNKSTLFGRRDLGD